VNIAVLTLTRDRLDYTQHCFAALEEYAGCDFDHWVLDNGSSDGTAEWLKGHDQIAAILEPENIGIAAGMNRLLDEIDLRDYDVIVKVDNDCELTMPDTLRDVAQLADQGNCILSPRILGLNNPPQPTRGLMIGGEQIQDVPQIGGIFLAAPAWLFDGYRYHADLPFWGGDDAHICQWFRQQGGTCGYVKRLEAWHYRGTTKQWADHPDYFARTLAEGTVAL
jgi:GT2 family glycosyltransferase